MLYKVCRNISTRSMFDTVYNVIIRLGRDFLRPLMDVSFNR